MEHQVQRVDNYIEEDEIDLRELFRTLAKNKLTIITITTLITVLAILYVLIKTPIYEVKSNLMVGFLGLNKDGKKINIANPDSIAKRLNIVFNVEDNVKVDEFVSEVTSISINKKLKNFITIKTEAISNEEALKKNKEVVTYAQELYQPRINKYILDIDNKIRLKKVAIDNLENLEKKNIQRRIELLKTQDVVKLDTQINFNKKIKLPALERKVLFQDEKLKEYTKEINNIYQSAKNSKSSTALTISSIQMINYQNLILNAQNKIEDLKSAIEVLKNQTIPELERKKKNLIDDTLRKLEYTLNVTLESKRVALEKDIERLKYNKTEQNVQNSKVIGDYIIKDYPLKPKKKLIVIVAFITGLILSIFLVFFLEFIKGFKDEEDEEAVKKLKN